MQKQRLSLCVLIEFITSLDTSINFFWCDAHENTNTRGTQNALA